MGQTKLEEESRKNKKELPVFAALSNVFRSNPHSSKKENKDKKSTRNDAHSPCSSCPCPFPCPSIGRKSKLFDSSSSLSSSCSSTDNKMDDYTEEEQKEEVKSNHFY